MTATLSRWLRTAVLAVGVALPALALSGCGQARDRELSERLMAAQVAAERAEHASNTAQQAAAKIASNDADQQVVTDDPPSDDEAEPADPAEDTPDDGDAEAQAFDNDIHTTWIPAPPAQTAPMPAPAA